MIVSREEAEQRRGFDPPSPRLRRASPEENRARNRSLFFDDLLDAQLRTFNPCYGGAEGALLGQFRHLHTDIYGSPPSPRLRRTGRELVDHLRNPPSPRGYGGTGQGKFFDHEEKRERDLILIDYEETARDSHHAQKRIAA